MRDRNINVIFGLGNHKDTRKVFYSVEKLSYTTLSIMNNSGYYPNPSLDWFYFCCYLKYVLLNRSEDLRFNFCVFVVVCGIV